ncbi:MAG TPA: SHOCT domain-containing protein [Marine Group III euryarchaeote]|uniref:SHOCT domain-containing protein n=1 Tax=Marine Group III euryarchaeote TaxID=2173149 RepID=A0A7C7PPG9_9ARCH|nr:SHOCT domain-containing protein [Marine Group III euryarchaeote]HIC61519.1 SHOCT domain-containing protein [Marine Group III euryarchaeote]
MKKTPLRKPKEPESGTKPENDKIKRLKELAELNKMGILTTAEFEKLKADLIN